MESVHIGQSIGRVEQYRQLIPRLKALVEGEPDLIANISNIAAALKNNMNFFWVGFYLNKGNNLVLGPFQGPVACTRIPYSKGVCGAAFISQKTILVSDVEKFPGHIACSADSKSEIVVPVFAHQKVIMVLDADSDSINDFSAVDQQYLEEICQLIGSKIQSGAWT